MNKGDLIKLVAEKANISKAQATDAINATFDGIQDALVKEDKAAFIGFGTFSISERKARVGINPSTRAEMKIPAMKLVKFKPGKALKDAVR